MIQENAPKKTKSKVVFPKLVVTMDFFQRKWKLRDVMVISKNDGAFIVSNPV